MHTNSYLEPIRQRPSAKRGQKKIRKLLQKFYQLRNQDAEKALRVLEKIPKQNSLKDKEYLTTQRAWCHLKLGQNSLAQKTIEEITDLNETNMNKLNILSILSFRRADFSQAINFAKRSLEISPQNNIAETILIHLYIQKKDFGQAMATIEAMLKKAYRPPAIVEKMKLFRNQNKIDLGIDTGLQALKKFPRSRIIISQLAELYRKKRQYQNAIEILNNLNGEKKSTEFLILAYCQINIGKLDEAYEAFLKINHKEIQKQLFFSSEPRYFCGIIFLYEKYLRVKKIIPPKFNKQLQDAITYLRKIEEADFGEYQQEDISSAKKIISDLNLL